MWRSPQSGLERCKGAGLISPHQGTGVAADTRQHHTSWTVGALAQLPVTASSAGNKAICNWIEVQASECSPSAREGFSYHPGERGFGGINVHFK